VSYNAERGEWRFDVEHFSRYGLIDEDSEEEETEAAAKGGGRAAAAAPLPPADEQGSDAMQEGECVGIDMTCCWCEPTQDIPGGKAQARGACFTDAEQH